MSDIDHGYIPNSSSISNLLSEAILASLPDTSKILALDLDETLVYCKTEPFDTATAIASISQDGANKKIYISKRPGVKRFLREMAKLYILVLFTSGTQEYANVVLSTLKIESYFLVVLHREHCRLNSKGKYEKNLLGLGLPMSEVVLVDDSLVHLKNQPENLLTIKPYRGEKNDRELLLISEFLAKLAKESDVRPVMKRLVHYLFYLETNSPAKRVFESENNQDEIKSLKTIEEEDLILKVTWDDPKVIDSEFGGTDENEDGVAMAERLSRLGWDRTITTTFETMTAKLRSASYIEKQISKELHIPKKTWRSEFVAVEHKSSSTQPFSTLETNSELVTESANEVGLKYQPPVISTKLQYLKMNPAKNLLRGKW